MSRPRSPRPVEERVAVLTSPLKNRRHVGLHALVHGTGGQLRLGDPLGSRGLRGNLDVGGLLLGVTHEHGRGLLSGCHQPGRLLVRVAQHLGALLTESGSEPVVVDGGIGGALFGFGELTKQVFFARFPRRELGRKLLEIAGDLRRVVAATIPREGAAWNVFRSQAGRRSALGGRHGSRAYDLGASWGRDPSFTQLARSAPMRSMRSSWGLAGPFRPRR